MGVCSCEESEGSQYDAERNDEMILVIESRGIEGTTYRELNTKHAKVFPSVAPPASRDALPSCIEFHRCE